MYSVPNGSKMLTDLGVIISLVYQIGHGVIISLVYQIGHGVIISMKESWTRPTCYLHGSNAFNLIQRRFFPGLVIPNASLFQISYEPVHDKTNNLGFRPGPTQTSLYSHRRNPES